MRLDEVYDAMRECYRRVLVTCRGWHAVTVGRDGKPYVRMEISKCVSQAEYFQQGDTYPVTVWSRTGNPDPGLSEDEIEDEVLAFEPSEQFDNLDEIVERLEKAGYTVE